MLACFEEKTETVFQVHEAGSTTKKTSHLSDESALFLFYRLRLFILAVHLFSYAFPLFQHCIRRRLEKEGSGMGYSLDHNGKGSLGESRCTDEHPAMSSGDLLPPSARRPEKHGFTWPALRVHTRETYTSSEPKYATRRGRDAFF